MIVLYDLGVHKPSACSLNSKQEDLRGRRSDLFENLFLQVILGLVFVKTTKVCNKTSDKLTKTNMVGRMEEKVQLHPE